MVFRPKYLREEIIEFALDEEVLLFLDRYHRYKDEYEVPFEVSQKGIARGVDIAINNLSRTLKKMMDKKLIEEKLKRVKGMPRRVKTYFLTEDRGRVEVYKLIEFINDTRIQIKESDEEFTEIRFIEIKKRLSHPLHIYELYKILKCKLNDKNDILENFEHDNEARELLQCVSAPVFRRRNAERKVCSAKYGRTDGEMIYNVTEKNGSLLKKTRKIPVKLTITRSADFVILSRYGITAMRRNKIKRLTIEAYNQGGLLTHVDLSNLMCCNPGTIRRDIEKLQNEGVFIPIMDYLEGQDSKVDPLEIMNESIDRNNISGIEITP